MVERRAVLGPWHVRSRRPIRLVSGNDGRGWSLFRFLSRFRGRRRARCCLRGFGAKGGLGAALDAIDAAPASETTWRPGRQLAVVSDRFDGNAPRRYDGRISIRDKGGQEYKQIEKKAPVWCLAWSPAKEDPGDLLAVGCWCSPVWKSKVKRPSIRGLIRSRASLGGRGRVWAETRAVLSRGEKRGSRRWRRTTLSDAG